MSDSAPQHTRRDTRQHRQNGAVQKSCSRDVVEDVRRSLRLVMQVPEKAHQQVYGEVYPLRAVDLEE
jgi:hypothetical protein